MSLAKSISQVTLLALSTFSNAHVLSAEFESVPSSECHILLEVRGEIAAGDKAKFLAKIESKRKGLPDSCPQLGVFIGLDSRGGDVHAAIDLGYAIRSSEATVKVHRDGNCLSSCVLLLAAGVDRLVYGRIGVHRPYFQSLDADATSAQIRQRRDATNKAIRKFLEDMDVSTATLDMMLTVRPEEIRYLNSELKQLRLSGKDATWDEKTTARLASFYGLRSSEYRSRNAKAETQCQLAGTSNEDIIRYQACQDAIILGISTREAQRRRSALGRCQQANFKDRFECRGSVMQGR